MSPFSRPPHSSARPAPAYSSGLGADIARRLRLAGAQAAAEYDLSVLRLGGIAPPTLPPRLHPHQTARDGDLARVEAQHRYAQLLHTRQQALDAAHPSAWQALVAGRPAHRPPLPHARGRGPQPRPGRRAPPRGQAPD